jgi:uncharacterized membrane protein
MRLRRFPSSLHKTLSFAVIHLAIAVVVGWLFTGAFVLAGALALVEPAVNTVTGHFLDKVRFERASTRLQGIFKSGLLGVSHLVVAIGVGLLLGGSWIAATAYAIVEPLANAVAHYFFERWWERRSFAGRPDPAFT